jgi:cellulase/cellobiase CelA1
VDDWGAGFVLNNYTVTNEGSAPISGWSVQIGFDQMITVTNAWNLVLHSQSGSQLTGSNAAYNGILQPGQSAVFGLQGEPGNVGTPSCVIVQ